MTDRELLELAKYNDKEMMKIAGKAIGESVIEFAGKLWINGAKTKWNPLDDDGDALRLAVKCHIEVQLTRRKAVAIKIEGQQPVTTLCEYEERGNAIRRAIVRAAAEIGRGME